ncbi:MAG: hypothetical protein GHCLOJNM_01971 [bacterium]|nr:hypothetical protein [bacterium]
MKKSRIGSKISKVLETGIAPPQEHPALRAGVVYSPGHKTAIIDAGEGNRASGGGWQNPYILCGRPDEGALRFLAEHVLLEHTSHHYPATVYIVRMNSHSPREELNPCLAVPEEGRVPALLEPRFPGDMAPIAERRHFEEADLRRSDPSSPVKRGPGIAPEQAKEGKDKDQKDQKSYSALRGSHGRLLGNKQERPMQFITE